MSETIECIRCEKSMRNIAAEGRGQQPLDGLAFNTPGHYGTTFFDPMDSSYIELSVCDECLRGADKAGRIHRYTARSG